MLIPHPFHVFPIHLYHSSKPAVIANDAEQESKARADGYTETYQHQEYPKHVTRADGTVITATGPDHHEDIAGPPTIDPSVQQRAEAASRADARAKRASAANNPEEGAAIWGT